MKIGDIEPVGVTSSILWDKEITEWLRAYRSATGRNLEFLHADIQWRGAWQTGLKKIATLMAHAGIPFGVIVDSDRPDTSDVDWVNHATERAGAIRQVLGHWPDQITFQSWSVCPRHFLPEDKKGTMTNLIAAFRS